MNKIEKTLNNIIKWLNVVQAFNKPHKSVRCVVCQTWNPIGEPCKYEVWVKRT